MNLIPDPVNILGNLFGEVTKLLPPDVATAINTTVGTILDSTDTSIKPGDPQPPGTPPIPVVAGTAEHGAARTTLEALVAVLNGVVQYGGALIPEPYETYLKDLIEALATIASWL